jgi:hypothetical protein
LGLSLEAISEPLTGPRLNVTPCLQDESSTVAFNVLAGRVGGFQVRVFDLRDENLEAPVLTTVAAFRSQTDLPSFEMSLKGLCGRIAEALKARPTGGEDKNPSKQLFIRKASDEQRICDFLTPPRLERLRLHVNRYRLTCNPEWVFIYRPGARIKARHLSQFLEETTKIAEALMTCASDLEKSAFGAAGGELSISRGAGA